MFKFLIIRNRVYAVLSALMALVISISPFESHLVMAILICLLIVVIGIDFIFRFFLNIPEEIAKFAARIEKGAH